MDHPVLWCLYVGSDRFIDEMESLQASVSEKSLIIPEMEVRKFFLALLPMKRYDLVRNRFIYEV
jgi:hypothetical protein